MTDRHSELTSKSSGKPSRKSKRAKTENTLFALSLIYKSMMKIDINKYGTKLDNANITFNQYVNSYIRLEGGDNGKVKVTQSNQQAAYDFDSTGEIPGWEQSIDTILVGKRGDVYSTYEDNKAPAKRDAPNIDGKPIFASKGAIKCSEGEELKCLLLGNLTQFDEDLKNDPETGKP